MPATGHLPPPLEATITTGTIPALNAYMARPKINVIAVGNGVDSGKFL
jgi:hypothetical protein